MDILCLMGLFPKEYEKTILNDSLGGVQNAANKFQWGIVDGLEKIDNVNCKIINSLYIGSYPKRYKTLKIPTFKFSHSEGSEDLNVGFTNITFLKNYSRYRSVKKEVNKWAKDNTGEKKAIIAYAMTSPFVEILDYVKKRYPQIVCCLVVPDLPQYMNASLMDNKLYKSAKKYQIKHFKHRLRRTDCYVFLTKYMQEWFDWDVKYTVVEGISSKSEMDNFDINQRSKKKAILYAGMIEERYGVLDLVKAFMKIKDKDWSLELFGNGTSVDAVKKLAEEDSRIHLRGLAPNEMILSEQKNVELLVNPRNDTQSFTKYSFPSKVIEYMGSGTPMIGYKLSGMPDEYVDYFYCVNSQEEDGLYNTLKMAIELSSEERKKMGIKAQKFIVNQKTAAIQCEKIIKMLRACMHE